MVFFLATSFFPASTQRGFFNDFTEFIFFSNRFPFTTIL